MKIELNWIDWNDALGGAGAACIVVGCAHWSRALAFIAAGVLLLAAAVLGARRSK